MRVAKLYNRIQDFAWGSASYLPELLGYDNPEQKPQAELWMGIHPLGESCVEEVVEGSIERTSLSQYLRSGKMGDGVGSETTARYQSLPFLFKVLAVRRPLSIQVHPSKAQAEEGFSRENAAGIGRNAPERNYKDLNHKPEVTLALTPFEAMCGFLPLGEIEQNFDNFATRGLLSFADHQSFFASLMGLDAKQKSSLLDSVLQSLSHFNSNVAKWVRYLAQSYPYDLGALAPLYLHLLCLEPGQTIYLPAGVLHGYLEGSAMELMANSDNVLRCGLTPKHQDVSELMKTVVFEEFLPRIIESHEIDLHRSYYPTAATEFRLERWYLRDNALYFPQKHPIMLAFVYKGCVEINDVTLPKGQSCIIPANSSEVSIKVCNCHDAILYVAVAKDM